MRTESHVLFCPNIFRSRVYCVHVNMFISFVNKWKCENNFKFKRKIVHGMMVLSIKKSELKWDWSEQQPNEMHFIIIKFFSFRRRSSNDFDNPKSDVCCMPSCMLLHESLLWNMNYTCSPTLPLNLYIFIFPDLDFILLWMRAR